MEKILKFFNDKKNYRILYLLVSLYFITIFSNMINISSFLSRIMILWGFYLITHDLIKYKLKIFLIEMTKFLNYIKII
jgi:hypothetical protein